MDILEMIKTALASMLVGGSYSIMFAISKINKGEAFEKLKFARTVAIGCVVGLAAHFTGYELTKDNYETYVAANGFIVVVVDNLWAVGRNYIKNK